MPTNDLCRKCKIEMGVVREQVIAGTKYRILKCEKCRHEVARAENSE
ncbi:hypothetical protein KY347_00700 [Candidatus Woesearchaeota archaeon]|nr:hypothetical protein [Candidatus Woesearchaeota archaeon]